MLKTYLHAYRMSKLRLEPLRGIETRSGQLAFWQTFAETIAINLTTFVSPKLFQTGQKGR
jgi:hypothetical protein